MSITFKKRTPAELKAWEKRRQQILEQDDAQRVKEENEFRRQINGYLIQRNAEGKPELVPEYTVEAHRRDFYDFSRAWQEILFPYVRYGAKEHTVRLDDLPRPGTERYVVPPPGDFRERLHALSKEERNRLTDQDKHDLLYRVKGCRYLLSHDEGEPGAGLYTEADGYAYYEHSPDPHPDGWRHKRTIADAQNEPECCAGAVWDMLAVLDSELPERSHYALAYHAIRLAEETEDVQKEERIALAAEIAKRAGELREHLGLRTTRQEDSLQAVDDDGVLSLDRRLAEYLRRKEFGDTGKDYADRYETRALDRLRQDQGSLDLVSDDGAPQWRGWINPGPTVPGGKPTPTWSPALNAFALVLWVAVVKPRLERERYKPPALSIAVCESVTEAHTKGVYYDGGHIADREGSQLSLFQRVEPIKVPSMDLATIERLAQQGLSFLGRVNGHRTLVWEIMEGHRRALEGEREPRVIRVPGGWPELARTVGAGHTRKAWEEVRGVVMAQAHLFYRWPDGSEGNMLSYSYRPARGRRKAEATVILGDQLLPDYVDQLRAMKGRGAREAKRLVPILDLPPLVGRPNEHGSQAAFWLRLMMELRRGAAEIPEYGGVRITPGRMAEMAEAAGLPSKMLSRVLDRWKQDGTDGPARITEVESDRYTLAEAHRAAREFLTIAGSKERGGKARNQRSRKRQRRK